MKYNINDKLPIAIACITVVSEQLKAHKNVKEFAKQLARNKRELGFNAEHFASGNDTFIRAYLPQAHANGIKVFLYHNVHYMAKEELKLHPDWPQRKYNGKIVDELYGSGMSPCVNSLPYRKHTAEKIRQLAQYDLDGIFLDGPMFWVGACWCEFCKKKFKEEYGLPFPHKWANWKDKSWKKFIDFRFNSIAGFLKMCNESLKKEKPNALIYMNCQQGFGLPWLNGIDVRRLAKVQDIVGTEAGFIGDKFADPVWKPAQSAQLIETQSSGKPRVIFISGTDRKWVNYVLNPTETKLLYANTIAYGAIPWYGNVYYVNTVKKLGSHTIDKPGVLTASEMNGFINKHRDYLFNTVSVANVAIMWSVNTASYYSSEFPLTKLSYNDEGFKGLMNYDNYWLAFQGYYEALIRSHALFDVIDEQAVDTGNIDRYKTVILPNCACLSARTAQILKEYVRRGGNLIATFETSLYNEWGEREKDFQLSDVFGASAGRHPFGPRPIDYITMPPTSSSTKARFQQKATPPPRWGEGNLSSDMLPSSHFGMEVKRVTSKPLAFFNRKTPILFAEALPPVTSAPAILFNKYGKGSVTYFTMNIDEHYYNFHNIDHYKLLTNPVRRYTPEIFKSESLPSSVSVNLRKIKDNSGFVLHLINFTGAMTRPIERVVTLKDIPVSLNLTERISSVTTPMSGKKLLHKREKNGVSFVLPELKEYEAVLLR